LACCRATATATFKAPIFTNENGITNEFLATGDFNHDGMTDVATSNKDSNNVSVCWAMGMGRSAW